MEFKNIVNKKINRKKFFAFTIISGAGYFIFNSFPFRIIKKDKKEDIVVSIKLNSQSVHRTKIGNKNV